MFNEEYRKRAQEIFDDLGEYCKTLVSEKAEITNISEIFVLKICEGLSQKKEKESRLEIAKECKSLLETVVDSPEDDELSVYAPPLKENLFDFSFLQMFQALHYAVNTSNDIERILSEGFGINNPSEIISEVNRIECMNDSDERAQCSIEMICHLISLSDKIISFLFIILVDSLRSEIIKLCREISKEDLLGFLKFIKYIGEKYYSLYQERISLWHFQFKKFLNNPNVFCDMIEQIGLIDIVKKYDIIRFTEIVEKNEDTECENENLPMLYCDIFFGLYHFLYQHPQQMVRLSFMLMSDYISPQVQEVVFLAMTRGNYRPLIQYEYEWWCRDTGKTLSIPYPFYDGAINLKDIGIVDYDLYKRQELFNAGTLEKVNTNQPLKNEYQVANELERISKELYPYFTIFDKNPSMEKGHTFIKMYLPCLITYVENIKDNYTFWGFSYLIYKSQYLNWNTIKFDRTFVLKIAELFRVDSFEIKPCVESKARMKAQDILKKSEIPHELLSMKELDCLGIVISHK